MGNKEELAAFEGCCAYHTVLHNHRFKSMNSTSKLLKITFYLKFVCVRTKTESIILNVFIPDSFDVLHCNLKNCTFVSL